MSVNREAEAVSALDPYAGARAPVRPWTPPRPSARASGRGCLSWRRPDVDPEPILGASRPPQSLESVMIPGDEVPAPILGRVRDRGLVRGSCRDHLRLARLDRDPVPDRPRRALGSSRVGDRRPPGAVALVAGKLAGFEWRKVVRIDQIRWVGRGGWQAFSRPLHWPQGRWQGPHLRGGHPSASLRVGRILIVEHCDGLIHHH